MCEAVAFETKENILTLYLMGRIDSGNARSVDVEIHDIMEKYPEMIPVIDCTDLAYIASAGLRIILKILKTNKGLRIINVKSIVYDILDMTGFTEMAKVERAYRVLSVEGCQVIGTGANGTVYRYDPETIIKVYRSSESLVEIKNERELARRAFVLGVPTAISYDVVKVGDCYGSVFELLNEQSLSQLIAQDPEHLDLYVEMYTDLLKKIHAALLRPGELPDMRDRMLQWVDMIEGELPEDLHEKVRKMTLAIPVDYHMLHADYHTKNVLVQDGEPLLIDMDTLCTGHPIFELAAMYLTYVGFDENTPENTLAFLGYPREVAGEFWKKSLARYLDTDDADYIQSVEEKAMVLGYVRLLRRTLQKKGVNIEDFETRRARCVRHLKELVPRVDSLTF